MQLLRTTLVMFLSLALSIAVRAQENSAIACADGIDNDGDGLVDCEDPECAALNNDGCLICGSGISFADTVLAYLPGCPQVDPYPEGATGLSDWPGITANVPEVVHLGVGGSLKLGFTNNLLTNSGDDMDDLWVFEVGSAVEGCFVALRPADASTLAELQLMGIPDTDGDGYYELGLIAGATSGFDIDAVLPGYAPGVLRFDAVELTDDADTDCAGTPTPGADIDAVCARSSISLPGEGPHLWGVFSKAVQNFYGPPSVLLRISPGEVPTAVQVDTVRRMPGSTLAELDALAQDATHGLLGFLVYPDSSVLCHVDTLTAQCSPLAPGLPGRDIRGAACDGNGELWAIDRNSNSLLRITVPSGQVVETVGITLNGNVFNMSPHLSYDIAFQGTVLYFQSSSHFFLLDALTGVLTPEYIHVEVDANDVFGNCAGSSSYPPSFGGIAFHWGADTLLYGTDVNCEDDLYIYAMDQQPAVEVVSNPVPQFNSGSSDLASLIPSFTVGVPNKEPAQTVLHAFHDQGTLFLNGPQLPSTAMLRISDMLGRTTLFRKMVDPMQPIQDIDLAPGIHVIQLVQGGRRWTTKLMVR